jgi:tryptophanyl-tRNA synthetase
MRPTGRLHLGHYHGVLKNWVQLQHEYECFFFVADWHALTTHYEDPSSIEQSTWEMVVDWLAAGISPGSAKLFIQSKVPEHAELHTLLSMITPLSWLERVPTYKDQQEKLKEKDLATYGFLGYPLLQSADILVYKAGMVPVGEDQVAHVELSADILVYKAGMVPVGEDQVAHVELTREVARRFNHLYGREPDFKEKAKQAAAKMGKKNARMFFQHRKDYQEKGDAEALSIAHALLDSQQNISIGDKERLFGYLEGSGKIILPEPQALLTPASKMPGLDGQKMSKSYNNTIALRDDPDTVAKKLRTMPTDPARVRRDDPGDPEKCPVWQFHKIYSDDGICEWVKNGCRNASIGCVECKQPIIESVLAELKPMQERAKDYEEDVSAVKAIIEEGNEAAREVARDTLEDVRKAMGIAYL